MTCPSFHLLTVNTLKRLGGESWSWTEMSQKAANTKSMFPLISFSFRFLISVQEASFFLNTNADNWHRRTSCGYIFTFLMNERSSSNKVPSQADWLNRHRTPNRRLAKSSPSSFHEEHAFRELRDITQKTFGAKGSKGYKDKPCLVKGPACQQSSVSFRAQWSEGESSYLWAFPDGEFLTLGLLECIDRNPKHTATHTDRFLSSSSAAAGSSKAPSIPCFLQCCRPACLFPLCFSLLLHWAFPSCSSSILQMRDFCCCEEVSHLQGTLQQISHISKDQ